MFALVVRENGEWKIRTIADINSQDYQEEEYFACLDYRMGRIEEWRGMNLMYHDKQKLMESTSKYL